MKKIISKLDKKEYYIAVANNCENSEFIEGNRYQVRNATKDDCENPELYCIVNGEFWEILPELSFLQFTRAEYIEFSQMWEWHRKNYLAERKRMRELFQIAYYDKFKMYASETCDEYEAQRKKKDNDLTFEDILAINMMAAACKNKSFYKQIGEANDDEDDE